MNDMADELNLRRRRVSYRARHRGIKEMDLIFSRFADEVLETMDGAQLTLLEALVQVPDRDLYGWITGSEPVPAEYDNEILASLKALSFAPTDYSGGA